MSDSFVGRGGRDELDAPELGPLARRKVGDDQAVGAGGASVGGEPLVAVGLEQRGVGHRDQRDVDASPGLRQALEAAAGAHPVGQRPLGGPADHRPVGERVRERKAELDDVGAAGDRGLGELGRVPPGHQVDDERLHPVTCARSLSPRPERQRTTSSASRSSTRASAWAGSSAGRIPSVSASRRKAASASSSVACR